MASSRSPPPESRPKNKKGRGSSSGRGRPPPDGGSSGGGSGNNKRKRNEKDNNGVGAPSSSRRGEQKQRRAVSATTLDDVPASDLTPQQRCDLIAELGEAVLEDPESAFTSARIAGGGGGGGGGASDAGASQEDDGDASPHSSRIPSKVSRLIDLADPSSTNGGGRDGSDGSDAYTPRLAMLSLLAVFQDVLPTYRIRLPTAAERSVRVTKETKKLWDYERNLLSHYQLYLKLLERTWGAATATATATGKKGGGKGRGGGGGTAPLPPSSLSVTAILCLCELLKAAPHFNFRSNVMGVVVRQMNNRTSDEVCSACCGAVEHVFRSDAQGEVALEATRMVSKMTKERNFAVRPEVLRAFLALPLRVHEDEAQAAKLAAEAKKRMKKKDREGADIEAEMREGDATVDKIVLARAQADTLHAVTLTYFRILKSDGLSDGRVAELLPPALEGLAKFSHLINMDTVVDLLGVLRAMLRRVDALPLDAALNCVLTSFQILEGPGREMQIDQKEYVTPLYGLLPRLCTDGGGAGGNGNGNRNSKRSNNRSNISSPEQSNTDLALKCLHAAFIKRREHSAIRTAAFVKQLCTVALHAPARTAAPLLAFVRQLVQRYPAFNLDQLLENEEDIIASGSYRPGGGGGGGGGEEGEEEAEANNSVDPEDVNPFATSAWELATLKFHVHPMVTSHAAGAASGVVLSLPAEAPDRIRANLVRDEAEGYIRCRMSRKKHPLLRAGGGNDKRRRRQQVRFISPRKTAKYHLM